jgi:4-hydroxy-4-methyl-2-oxoglutarate aldolase
MTVSVSEFERPAETLFEDAARHSTATRHEAPGQLGAISAAIKPIRQQMCVSGPAFTALSPPRDNLWLHRAIYGARSGDILVADVGGFHVAMSALEHLGLEPR